MNNQAADGGSTAARWFRRLVLIAVAATAVGLAQTASSQTTRPAQWSVMRAPDCTAYAPCGTGTDPIAACFASMYTQIRHPDCAAFTGLTDVASGDYGNGTAWCRANANFAADGSCWWFTAHYTDALGDTVSAYCEILKSSTEAVTYPKRLGELDYVCPVVIPPPPPSPPLGCAFGEGGFSACPGDTGVPSSGPPASPPPGTPPSGGPGPNIGAPGSDSSDGPTDDAGTGSGSSCKRVEAAGDPVFPATGNVYQEEIDYAGPVGLNVVRRYNSALPGWVHNYSARILASSTAAKAVRPDGRVHTFTGSGPGRWAAESTALEQLIQLTPADTSQPLWQYSTADDGTEWYDATGRLMAIMRRGGLRYTVQQSDGLLRGVSDSFGRSLQFSYDDQRRLVRVTPPESTSIAYGYDGQGRLFQVTYPDGTTRQYLYENAAYPLALTGILDENKIRAANWDYDANGRAVTSSRALSTQSHQFQYNSDGSARITDPLGTTRTQSYSWVGSRALFAGQTQPCAFCVGDAASRSLDATTGMPTQSTDYLGVSTVFTNDGPRRLPISVTRAAGRPEAKTVQTQWHPTWRVPVLVTETGRVTSYSYDDLGNLLTKAILDTATNQGRTWKWTYNAQKLNDSYTDARGSVWTYGYDSGGNRVSVTNPLGLRTGYGYDAAGRVVSMTEPNGLATTYSYDARGRLVRQVRGDETTTYAYSPTGQLTSATMPSGYQVTYVYDAPQRLVATSDNRGASIQYTLDAAGNRVREEVKDASGAIALVTSRIINGLNKVAAIQGALGQTTALAYDANGEPVAQTDPLNQTTRQTLDSLRRPVATTFADNASVTQAWNQLDQLTQVTDPKGVSTRYQNNAFGEVVSEASPDIGSMTYQRDAAGEVTGITDAAGNNTTIARDALGRPTTIQYAPDNLAAFSYDQGQVGYLAKIDDKSGTTTYERDAQGRVLGKAQTVNDDPASPSRYKVQYGYSGGELASITYPSGLKVVYNRAAGRITGIDVQEPSANPLRPKPVVPFVTNLAHTALGQPRTWQWSSADQASRSFDTDGRMSANEFASYSYDAASRIAGITQNLWASRTVTTVNGTATVTLSELYTTPLNWMAGYDSRNRLASLVRFGASTSFSYDPNSNRLTAVDSITSDTDLDGVFEADDFTQSTSQTLNVDAGSNKLLGFTQTVTKTQAGKTKSAVTTPISYSLDANGAMTGDGLRTFEYDATRRLSKVRLFKDGEAAKLGYLHNALGQRVFKSEVTAEQTLPNESTLGLSFIDWLKKNFQWMFVAAQANTSVGTAFVYDEDGSLLGEYDNGSAAGKGRQEYIWLPTDSGQAIPIGIYKGGRFYAVHADHLGTPRLITDDGNKPVWQWPYSAFGNNKPTGVLKATPNPKAAITNQPVLLKATNPGIEANLRFPGQYFDEESNLNYNYFRSYSAAQGRYSQPDPIGIDGGWNRFAYVDGNPLSYVDPDGRQAQAIPIIVPIVIVGCALTPGCRDAAKNWMESRSRGKNDPVVLPPVNPGRDCDGNCNPCPKGAKWFVDKPGHGHENGYWHEIRYNQDPKTCMCYPDRPSTGLQGF